MKKNITLNITLTLLVYLLLNLNNCNLKANENLNKENQDKIDKEFKTKDEDELGFQSDEVRDEIIKKEKEEEAKSKDEDELGFQSDEVRDEIIKKEKEEEAKYEKFKKDMEWYSLCIDAIHDRFVGFIGYVKTYGGAKPNLTEIKKRYEEDNEKYGLKKNKERIQKWLEGMSKVCGWYNVETTLSKTKETFKATIQKFESTLENLSKESKDATKAAMDAASELAELYKKIEEISLKSYLKIFSNVVFTDDIFKIEKFKKLLKEEYLSKIKGTESCLSVSKESYLGCHEGIENKDLLP